MQRGPVGGSPATLLEPLASRLASCPSHSHLRPSLCTQSMPTPFDRRSAGTGLPAPNRQAAPSPSTCPPAALSAPALPPHLLLGEAPAAAVEEALEGALLRVGRDEAHALAQRRLRLAALLRRARLEPGGDPGCGRGTRGARGFCRGRERGGVAGGGHTGRALTTAFSPSCPLLPPALVPATGRGAVQKSRGRRTARLPLPRDQVRLQMLRLLGGRGGAAVQGTQGRGGRLKGAGACDATCAASGGCGRAHLAGAAGCCLALLLFFSCRSRAAFCCSGERSPANTATPRAWRPRCRAAAGRAGAVNCSDARLSILQLRPAAGSRRRP